ncbi:DegV family protein [Chloroflexota bacterium]
MTYRTSVEVIDSKSVSMGCGLTAISAARAAMQGANSMQVIALVNDNILRTHIIGMVTNVRHILGGRRLSLPGKDLFLAKLGAVLRFKLLGEIYEAGKLRGRGMFLSKAKALARLEQILTEQAAIESLSILHAHNPDWAQDFSRRIASVFPENNICRARLGCITGIHSGPEAVAIAFTERKGDSRNAM